MDFLLKKKISRPVVVLIAVVRIVFACEVVTSYKRAASAKAWAQVQFHKAYLQTPQPQRSIILFFAAHVEETRSSKFESHPPIEGWRWW
jgi:hypothetical protein